MVASESFYFPFVTPKAYLFRIVVEALAVLWAATIVCNPRRLPRPSPVLLAFVALTLIALAADLASDRPGHNLVGDLERMGGFAATAHLAALLVVAATFLRTAPRWRLVLGSSVIASAATATVAVLQTLGLRPLEHATGRVDGGLGNPAFLAGFLLANLFAAAYLWADARPRKTVSWALATVIVADSVGLVLSGTRSALLGLAAGLAVMVVASFERPSRRRGAVLALLTASILFVLAITLVPKGVRTGFEPADRVVATNLSEASARARVLVWRLTLAGAAEHPFVGWGEEGFGRLFARHYDPELWTVVPNRFFDRPHNAPLRWLAAAGVGGLIAYLVVIVSAGIGIRRASSRRLARAALAGWLAASLVHTLFVFEDLSASLMMVLLLALIHTSQPSAGAPTGRGRGFAVACAIGAVALSAIAAVATVADPACAERDLVDGLHVLPEDPASGLARLEAAASESPLVAPHACERLLDEVLKLTSLPALTDETRQRIIGAASQVAEHYLADADDDVRRRLAFARFLNRSGNPDAAARQLEVARSQAPSRPDILVELTTAELNRRRQEAALAAAQAARELVPGDPGIRDILALTAIYAGRRAQAEAILAAAHGTVLVADPRFIAAYATIGDFDAVVATLSRVPSGQRELRETIAASALREIRMSIGRNPEWTDRGADAIRRIREIEP